MPELSFVLAQLGMHLAGTFAARLAPLGLEPRHFGVLNRLAFSEGESQQAVARQIGLSATRMVFVIDELERLSLVERRRNPADRRSHALYLTDSGRDTLARARQAAAAHEESLCAPLTAAQRHELVGLLRQLADAQGILASGLPGNQVTAC